jgi:hypothetical protein
MAISRLPRYLEKALKGGPDRADSRERYSGTGAQTNVKHDPILMFQKLAQNHFRSTLMP